MKVSIFQPSYLSWLGFYKAIAWADKFVFLDDVQFARQTWQNRNRIKTLQGALWLTVPVVRNFPQPVKEVKINYSRNWMKDHLKSIQFNYSRAPFFKEFSPVLESFYQARPEKLIELNVSIIKEISDFLGIKTDFYYSSKLGMGELNKNKKIVAILKKLSADQYLHAAGSREYMEKEIELYQDNGIELIPLKFEHPAYEQLFGEFIPYLSIIDAIFNCGRNKTKLLINNIKL